VSEIRLEMLVGRRVRALNGRPAGHLEEIRVERRGGAWVITEYHVGALALLERLAIRFVRWPLRRIRGWRVRWDQLDVSDPRRPRLTCPLEELDRLG
jgi:hypothetical protein